MALTPQQRRQQLLNIIGPPPAPPKRNDPSIPTIYDPQWQFYVDLTPAQIAAFQAMPEWAVYVATQPVTDWAARAAAEAKAASPIAIKLPPQ